jgi:threonine/homoserine/homoserine lactone efflux protein
VFGRTDFFFIILKTLLSAEQIIQIFFITFFLILLVVIDLVFCSGATGSGATNAAAYARLAARLSGAVRRPGLRRGLNRVGGAMLVGAGLAVVFRRS